MARHFLRRYLPRPDALLQHRSLRLFRRWLHHPDLWHLNRRSASTGLAIGLFMAFVPMPMQMVPATALALVLRANIPLAIAGVWVTNPLTIPPIALLCYQFGAWLLGTPARDIAFEVSWAWFAEEFSRIWQPFLLGSLVFGIASAAGGYFGIRWLWRWHVVRAWERRAQLKLLKKAELARRKEKELPPNS